MKFEIIRTDIKKVVLKATEFPDAAYAFGQYLCAITLVGILRSADDYTHIGGNSYVLKNGWKLEVREVA